MMGRLCTQQIMTMQDENVVDHQMPSVRDNEDVSVIVESDEGRTYITKNLLRDIRVKEGKGEGENDTKKEER